MGDSNDVIDFADVDTDLIRSPNVISADNGSDDADEDGPFDLEVPETAENPNPLDKASVGINTTVIKILLTEASQTSGIAVTEHMTTTAVALGHSIGLEPHSMDWFLAGINYANNTMLQERIVTSVKDLQTEVRNVQNATAALNQLSSEFFGKMARNKREILEEMDKTRETVLKTLRDCSVVSTDFRVADDDHQNLADQVDSMLEKDVPLYPKPVDPILRADALSASIPTISPEKAIHNKRVEIMRDLGFSAQDIERIGAEGLKILVTDVLIDQYNSGWTQQVKDIALELIVDTLVEAEMM